MSSPPRLHSLADQLPFELKDIEAANSAFERWIEHQTREEKRTVDVWTYCFIVDYFYTKSIRDEIQGVSDVEDLVSQVYDQVIENRSDLRKPGRYAHWVSVICKRTFLNYVRNRFEQASFDAEDGPRLPVAETPRSYADVGFTRQAVTQAIRRLPEYLQETARLYFIEECTFTEISEAIDKPVETVRAYKYKVVRHLRDDDALRTLYELREM